MNFSVKVQSVSVLALAAACALPAARLFEPQQGIPQTLEAVNSEGRLAVVPAQTEELGGLVWIWSEEPDQPHTGLLASYLSDPETRIFERQLRLDSAPGEAVWVIAASGQVKLEINGTAVASTVAPDRVHSFPIGALLQAGENHFRVTVEPTSAERAAAGLIGRIVVPTNESLPRIYPIDTSWTVRRQHAAATPERTVIVGPYGIEPWGQIAGPLLPPPDFPRFENARYARPMELLRELTLRYYRYGSKPTYKDFWKAEAYLWVGLADPAEYQRNDVLWRTTLSERHIDDEGYVSTMQHIGLGHPHGWPFPYWMQAQGAGWAFSYEGFAYLEFQARYRGYVNDDPQEWTFHHAQVTGQEDPEGVTLRLTGANAWMESPAISIDHRVSPFFSIEWVADALEGEAQPWLQWITGEAPEFSSERQVPFTFDPDARGRQRGLAELYRHPLYSGPITGFRIGFGNAKPADISVKIAFSTQDTRHNTNNASFIGGVYHYLAYTGDHDFLKEQLPRLRKALRYAFEEFGIPQHKHVRNPWVGHDGRGGVEYRNGQKIIHYDRGMGNNYWDLLPFGGNDFYASMLYHMALLRMAEMEVLAARLWPQHDDAFAAAELRQLAAAIRAHANDYFWNEATGRFPSAIDFEGVKHDYGFTFVNLEAIYFDFADEAKARSIMEWINGDRLVPTDTAQGADIYRWRFAPRATTRRNWEYYKFAAHASPERFPFGDQIQDGGAGLGFSFHDLMARHRILGPDNAWQRLLEIMQWYEEVWDAGGYLAYYENNPGTLQSPQPGGLGLHREFTEPALLPLYLLQGLFGFRAHLDGFQLNPSFPSTVDDFSVTRVRYQDALIDLHRRGEVVEVELAAGSLAGRSLYLPQGDWLVQYFSDAVEVETRNISNTPAADRRIPFFRTSSRRSQQDAISGTTRAPLQINASNRIILRPLKQ